MPWTMTETLLVTLAVLAAMGIGLFLANKLKLIKPINTKRAQKDKGNG